MIQAFADTSFFVALLNPRDVHHATAADLQADFEGRILTTGWVLTELLGNYLAARPTSRKLFAPFVRDLPTDSRMEVVPVDREQFEAGCALYEARPDKEWSLTDCISMTLMERRSIRDVFSSDHHFEQAGFTILLK